MPLTKKMRKVKRSMEKSYGKERGERVFYAWENKHKTEYFPKRMR